MEDMFRILITICLNNTAGSYYGAAGILEYVLFAFNSDFIKAQATRVDTSFKMYDENTETCVFRMMIFLDGTPNPNTTNNEINRIYSPLMTNVELDYSRGIVS